MVEIGIGRRLAHFDACQPWRVDFLLYIDSNSYSSQTVSHVEKSLSILAESYWHIYFAVDGSNLRYIWLRP